MSIREESLNKKIQEKLSKLENINVVELLKKFPEFTRNELEQLIRRIQPTLLYVLDKKGHITDKLQTYDQVHNQKILHLAVQVVVLTADDRLVLRHRNDNKKWDISASGHVLVGETPVTAAHRVVKERLDIDASLDQFTQINPPNSLKNFIKWGRFDRINEPCYGESDGIFRYRGRDQENFEHNELFVLRVSPSEPQADTSTFRPTTKVSEIKLVWAEGLSTDIDSNPELFASGARQYFQDHEYRKLIIDKIWKGSRRVYAFDYDHTLEDKNWPLRASMAKLLARLITEKGARIALMSAKAMGEIGRMEEALTKFMSEGKSSEASDIQKALDQKYGIMEFAATRILNEIQALIKIDLRHRDTENMLILFPAKSNAKYSCIGDTFQFIEKKTISETNTQLVIKILNQFFSELSGGNWPVYNTEDKTRTFPHVVFFDDDGVAKILIKPFAANNEIRNRFVEELRQKINQEIPDLVVDKGGTSSVDITPVGKVYGINNLFGTDEHSEVFYFGDEPDGSDRSVFESEGKWTGLKLFDVSYGEEQETEEIIKHILRK